MVLALMLGGVIGWRNVFFITGSLGIVLAVAIFFGVKDVPRGSSETELQGVEVSKYKFNWQSVREIFSKRSLYFVFAQGFIGVFPWNVITYYFFGYLATDRGYDSNTQLMIMAPAVLVMALGYPLGGVLGDRLFKKTKRGRLIVSAVGILLGMVFLTITMNVAQPQVGLFTAMLLLTALFMPFSSPNIVPTIFDVTLPEVRSTANAVQNFIEYIGSASAPLIAGIIADRFSVGTAILSISLITWALCFLLILVAIVMIPKDINAMHAQLEARAAAEKAG
jgi:predicted MFS family arabinose efflux permease